jgi:Tfp pilus assembly PilM family ATPase
MTISPNKKKPVQAGLSITHRSVELVVFSPKSMAIEQSYSLPLPDGLFDQEMDTVRDISILKEQLAQLLAMAKPRPVLVHVSLPGTLLRMVEMPKMDAAALYLSLSSEAERYKTFDHTEAVVDFVLVSNPTLPPNVQQLVLGAVRSDVLGIYLKLFKDLKLKPVSISLEPVNILRGMAASGVLDSLVQQIGDTSWGMIIMEKGRVRFSLWRADRVIEMRELVMDTSEFNSPVVNGMAVEDLLEEMRRTTKNESPAVWLTFNMPGNLEQVLSERLRVPVRSAPMGNAISMPQPVELSGLGVATSSYVPFPFEVDMMEGMKAAGGIAVSGGDSGGKIESGDSTSADLFIPIGVAGLGICAVVTGILCAMGFVSGQGIPELETKVESVKSELASLQVHERELRSKANLNQDLQKILREAKARTTAYVALTDELKERTPTEQVWIQSLKVASQDGANPMTMDGKALNHQSVINFARTFDDVPFTKSVLIDSIQEGKLGSTLVYDFKLSGTISLDTMMSKLDSAKSGMGGATPAAASETPSAKSGA